MADPGIDRRGGAPIFLNNFILIKAGKVSYLYALEESGILLWEILNSKASNDAFRSIFWPKYRRVFWEPERGRGLASAPSGSATGPNNIVILEIICINIFKIYHR